MYSICKLNNTTGTYELIYNGTIEDNIIENIQKKFYFQNDNTLYITIKIDKDQIIKIIEPFDFINDMKIICKNILISAYLIFNKFKEEDSNIEQTLTLSPLKDNIKICLYNKYYLILKNKKCDNDQKINLLSDTLKQINQLFYKVNRKIIEYQDRLIIDCYKQLTFCLVLYLSEIQNDQIDKFFNYYSIQLEKTINFYKEQHK